MSLLAVRDETYRGGPYPRGRRPSATTTPAEPLPNPERFLPQEFALVGVRADGTELILETALTGESAQRRVRVLRKFLEGYRELRVEELQGETAGGKRKRLAGYVRQRETNTPRSTTTHHG